MQLQPTAPDFAKNFAARALGGSETDRGAGFAALLRQNQTAAPAAPPPAAAPVAPPAPQSQQPSMPVAPAVHPTAAKAAAPTDAEAPAADAPADAAPAADASTEPTAGDATPPPATPADAARTLLRARLRTADGTAAKTAKGTKSELAVADNPTPAGKAKLATTSPVHTEAVPTPLPGVQPDVATPPRPDADATGADAPADTPGAATPRLADALAARPEAATPPAATSAAPATPQPTTGAGADFAAMLSAQRVEAASGTSPRTSAIDSTPPAGPPSGAFGPTPAAGTAAVQPVDLPTPVASPDFSQHLGVQISVLAKEGVQHAELHLNPADMGPVSVQITLDGTQARIDFGADVAATRHAIEAGLPQLAGALADAGFTLAGGGVSQHAGGGNGGGQRGDTGRGTDRTPTTSVDDTGASARVARRSVRVGGLDLYA